MNILIGVDKEGEIPILSKYGADEFFCGYLPESWIAKYNKNFTDYGGYQEIFISLNRREKLTTNVKDKSSLEKMVQEAKERKVKLYLAINAVYFPGQSYPEMFDYLDEISQIGIRDVIVADLGLISLITDKYPHLNIILSTCQQVNNSWTGKFYGELNIKRITFPRHMTVNEITAIINANPDMEYEYFILEGKCVYDDGNCKVCHNIGGICTEKFSYEYYHNQRGTELNYSEYQELCRNEDIFNKWTFPSPKGYTINGWRNMGCAICTIPSLKQIPSIKALKIATRGLSTKDKVGMVKFIKKAIRLAEEGAERADLMKFGKETFQWPELCDNKFRCLLAMR
ncbi:peptidase U32 family protein [Paenibacillus tengchongensis]|uniref:peptidase U32 family protein n=1 Tax=Paenibacillus tengchongensis TaxID=2608684 RepID=UPI00124E2748|nr:U32 family peptidase [Paenibacillus tengchongensis]